MKSSELGLSAMYRILKKSGAERVSDESADELRRIIEDIGYYQNGVQGFLLNPEDKLTPEVKQILENNNAIWVDTTIGHRNWKFWVDTMCLYFGAKWATSREKHNSNMIVIYKRKASVKPVNTQVKKRAMRLDAIFDKNNN